MSRTVKVAVFLSAGVLLLGTLVVGFASPWIVGRVLKVIGGRAGVEIHTDAIRGSIFSPVELTGLVIVSADRDTMLRVERVTLGYQLIELITGHLTLTSLELEQPRLNLALTSSGENGSESGFPLLTVHDVEITDGAATITSNGEASRSYAVQNVDAEIPVVRLGRPNVVAELTVDRLAGMVDDPRITLSGLNGDMRYAADTLWVDFQSIDMAEAEGEIRGWVHMSSPHRASELTITFRDVTPIDVPFAIETLPDAPYRVAGHVNLVENGTGNHRVFSDSVRVTVDDDSTDLVVQADITLSPGGDWSVSHGRAVAYRISTDYGSQFVDTSLVSGVLSGRVTASGDAERLRFDLQLNYLDERDNARSALSATGLVSVREPKEAVFDSVSIRDLYVNLLTARRLSERIPAQGRVRAAGRLEGQWRNPTFRGSISHEGGRWPASRFTGLVRGLEFADLRIDSLQPELVREFTPSFELGGVITGRVSIRRSSDSVAVDTQLRTAAGIAELRADGPFVENGALLSGTVGLTAVNLAVVDSQFPSSSVTGRGLGSASLTTDGVSDWAIQFDLDTSLVGDLTVTALSLVASGDSTEIALDTLRIAGSTFSAGAAGRLSVGQSPSGRITFDVSADSLENFSVFADRWLPSSVSNLSGNASSSGTIEGTVREFDLRATVDAPRISLSSLTALQSRVDLSWQPADSLVSVHAVMDSLLLGPVALGAVDIQTGGAVDSLTWAVAANQVGAGGWFARGSFLVLDSTRIVGLDSAIVPLGRVGWTLVRPTLLTLGDSAFSVSDLVLQAPDRTAQVQVDGSVSTNATGRFTGRVTNVQMQSVARLLGRDSLEFGGELNGSFEVTGSSRSPRANAILTMNNVRARAMRVREARSNVSYEPGNLQGTIEIAGDTATLAQASFSLPMNIQLAPMVLERLDQPLRGELLMEDAPLSLISPLFPTWQNPQGQLIASANLNGTWSAPRLNGNVEISQGRLFIADLGVQLRDMEARIGVSADTVRILQFNVRGGDGEASASGYIEVEDIRNPVFSIDVNATRFPAIDVRDYMTMVVSGQLALAGSFDEPRLTGRGTATRGSVSFADVLQKQIVDLDDPLFAPYVDTTLLRAEGLSSGVGSQLIKRLRINGLAVALGNDFWMRSGEGDVQLTGNLTIDKTADVYSLDGTLNAERGAYRLQLAPGVTREFTVTRGAVRYFGTPDLDADLDIDARHTVRTFGDNPVNITAHLGGTLYRPTVQLSSDIRPPVSDGELISYLLFGSPTVQAFAGQGGTQSRFLLQETMDQFALALSGQAQTFVRGLGIPLDYLQIRPGDVNDAFTGTEVAIGKQFLIMGRPAFLTASPRLCPRQSFFSTHNIGASLESRLAGRFSLSASVDPVRVCETSTASISTRYQLGVDLLWEKRRD